MSQKQLDAIDAQIEKLKRSREEQLQKLKNRRSQVVMRMKPRKRNLDARRMILLGRCVVQMMERDPNLKLRIMQSMDEFLVKEHDRSAWSTELESEEAATARVA